ncbi:MULTISPECIES: glutaminase A [Nostocales]|uniref:Glutaminase n=3 Tax=Nostocales TaxID=1161 RepID=A0A0C1NAH3_9CYAN|nr:glutaminase A [Tolypothrix bouteillei]KAF3887589.1 glutaminase A [Tolypothrix bouteillei VB521301]
MAKQEELKITASSVEPFLSELHSQYKSLQDGAVANYIPELSKVNPELFSICIATVNGEVYQVGDYNELFTIQSISKVFVYGLALEDRGRDYLLTKVGVEPTGDAFNAIVLDEVSKRPYNPMVNAGAIATTSLIKGTDAIERLNRMLDMFRRYTGHNVFVDISVFTSERVTGHRNRAMAHLMLNFGTIDQSVDETLDLYFQQCAVMVNCRDLAVMAATLANKGINPITREQSIDSRYIKDILSVMYTCGMYNFAGEWAYKIGIPAKSGISGGIIAVIPNRMGIGVFSPLLDSRGNSIRGVKVCEELSQKFGLHLFNCSRQGLQFCE